MTYGYGYGGVSVGFGTGYSSGYYDPWYGAPYWGWYGDYYYPGTGFYVYDAGRRRHHWDDDTRRHWTSRREGWRGREGEAGIRENWRDFARNRRLDDQAGRTDRQARRAERGAGNVSADGRALRSDRRTFAREQVAGTRSENRAIARGPAARNGPRGDRGAFRSDQAGRQSFRGGTDRSVRSFRGSSRPTAGIRRSRPN